MRIRYLLFPVMLAISPAWAQSVPPASAADQPPVVTQAVEKWTTLIASATVLRASLDAMATELKTLADDDILAHQKLDKAVALGNWWESYAKGLESQMKAPESK